MDKLSRRLYGVCSYSYHYHSLQLTSFMIWPTFAFSSIISHTYSINISASSISSSLDGSTSRTSLINWQRLSFSDLQSSRGEDCCFSAVVIVILEIAVWFMRWLNQQFNDSIDLWGDVYVRFDMVDIYQDQAIRCKIYSWYAWMWVVNCPCPITALYKLSVSFLS